MGVSKYGNAIGTNFIRHISISSNAVRAYKDGLNTSTTHEMTSHIIRD